MSKHTETLPPHFGWNFGAFMVDYVCFSVAITFASVSSVMPNAVATPPFTPNHIAARMMGM